MQKLLPQCWIWFHLESFRSNKERNELIAGNRLLSERRNQKQMATYPAIVNWSHFGLVRVAMRSVSDQLLYKIDGRASIADIVIAISPEVEETVKTYKAIVLAAFKDHAQSIQVFVAKHGALPRKEFASLVMKQIDPRLRLTTFATLDGKEPSVILSKMLMKACSSEARTKAYCDLFGLPLDMARIPATVH